MAKYLTDRFMIETKEGEHKMTTREEALEYGLSFPDTYQQAPFHDTNWQLVRVKGSKKAFLECKGEPGMARFLESCISFRNTGLASEQRTLEYGNSGWLHTG